MSCSRDRSRLLVLCMFLSGPVCAEGTGYVLGGGAESDSASGRALSLFADVGIAEKTWLTGAFARMQTGGELGGLDTIYADAGLDHWFEPLGVRASAAYWGDADILDSADLRGSLYFRNERASLSLDYERRDFDFTVVAPLTDARRTAEFQADGFGLSSRIAAGDTVSFYAGGMSYEYSRDISLQPDIDVLRVLSTSRLSLMNSLIDYRYNVGIGFEFGLQSIDLRMETWQTAVDQGRVNSIAMGFLTPVADRSDMEFRFAYDESENFGSTVSLSVFIYFFGG